MVGSHDQGLHTMCPFVKFYQGLFWRQISVTGNLNMQVSSSEVYLVYSSIHQSEEWPEVQDTSS